MKRNPPKQQHQQHNKSSGKKTMQLNNPLMFFIVIVMMITFGSVAFRKSAHLDTTLIGTGYNISDPLGNLKRITNQIINFGNRIPSVSPGYYKTQEYISNFVRTYTNYFQVGYDNFTASTPIFGNLKMSNIIINFVPPQQASSSSMKRIIMSCHYESKYFLLCYQD